MTVLILVGSRAGALCGHRMTLAQGMSLATKGGLTLGRSNNPTVRAWRRPGFQSVMVKSIGPHRRRRPSPRCSGARRPQVPDGTV